MRGDYPLRPESISTQIISHVVKRRTRLVRHLAVESLEVRRVLAAPSGDADGNTTIVPVGRYLFYNQSAFDGSSAAHAAIDDNAIATDKTAYIPNNTLAGFNNVSSYSRGINGIMVDLGGSAEHASINANDFIFKHGNNNSPSTWALVSATPTISTRMGGGVSGSDRVTITWASGSIRNEWLEVQVLPTIHTGLVVPDVHFWGNKVGDTGAGTPATTFLTSAADKSAVLGNFGGAVGITNPRDFNRDNNVTAADATIVLGNLGSINRFQMGPAGPFAPSFHGGIVPALASGSAGSTGSVARPSTSTPRSEGATSVVEEIAETTQNLAGLASPTGSQQWATLVEIADESILDDALLDAILDDLGWN